MLARVLANSKARFRGTAAVLTAAYVRGCMGKDISLDEAPLMLKLKTLGTVHVSHRGGGHSYGPENTLFSYKRCVEEHKTHVLEFDVTVSRDNKPVIMHNRTVDATTNGKGPIVDMTLQQIRELDAAYWYTTDGVTYPLRGKGIKVPTLEEVLNEFEGNKDLVLFFDLKHPKAVPHVLEEIKKRKLEQRTIIGAVPTRINNLLRRMKPKEIPMAISMTSMLTVCALYATNLLWLYRFDHHIVGFFINERTYKMVSKSFVDALHKRGRVVAVFGPLVNDPAVQQCLIHMGVDMIVTDRPDVLKSTLQEMVDK